jgi:bifunctional enzyme CysN/CysC
VDHLEELESRTRAGEEIDLSQLTDGLAAEREQGITIDVAWRYFRGARRSFIVADTPGHVQYTRNMVTGASTSDLAIILIDARRGVTQQTHRHAFLTSLLGVSHLVVAVNKMDAVNYDEGVFQRIRADFGAFASRLDVTDITFLPVSALKGDNVATAAENMPWFGGPTLLHHIENVHIASDSNLIDLRVPIQYIVRDGEGARWLTATIASGIIRPGESVRVMPSGRTNTVSAVSGPNGEQESAAAGEAVSITLADDMDVSRGDVLVHPGNVPPVLREFEAMLVWMDETPLRVGDSYWIHQGTQSTIAVVSDLRFQVDVETLRRVESVGLKMNEIARVRLSCTEPLVLDPYLRNRAMGAFILIDRETHQTAGAGVVRAVQPAVADIAAPAIPASETQVSRAERAKSLGQQGHTVWLTGLPASGKSSAAVCLERLLADRGHTVVVLDGSDVRGGLSSDLGFSADDRVEQVRRLAEVARLLNDSGLIVIVAAVSPYEIDRQQVIRCIGGERVLLAHCDAPLSLCEERDITGAYERARKGELSDFTGVTAPYEVPTAPDITLDMATLDVAAAADALLTLLRSRGALTPGEAK